MTDDNDTFRVIKLLELKLLFYIKKEKKTVLIHILIKTLNRTLKYGYDTNKTVFSIRIV